MRSIPQPPRTEAQQQYAHLLSHGSESSVVTWRLDLGNASLLSRSLPVLKARGVSQVRVEIPAVDRSESCTDIADEAELVGLVRHLRSRADPSLPLAFVLSVGRDYALPPLALDLSTTNRCGLACAMCSNRASRSDPGGLEPAELLGIIDQAASWGIGKVALTGAGEPLGDPHMLEYLEHAQRRGLRATLTTNGTPLSESLAEALASMAISISVSIHGATDRTHDSLVGVPGSRARAWAGVRRLIAARERAGTQRRLTVSVSSVIQRGNLDEIPLLVQQSLEEGCDGHNVQPINLQRGVLKAGRIVRRDDPERAQLLWPAPEDRARVDALFDAIEAWSAAHPGHLRASSERLASLRRHLMDNRRAASDSACPAGETFLGVDHRGEIRPCYRVPWRFGSIHETTLRQAWNSQAYARLRALMAQCPLTCMNSCFFRTKGRV